MKKHIRFAIGLLVVLVITGITLSFLATSGIASDQQTPAIADQIIAREKAGFEAWQRKDKAFFSDYLSDDATYFGMQSPYLETDPKVNFLPKFERMVEQFNIIDFQMYNPRVQVYGDVAILTYNHAVMANISGQPINYTGKMTAVYVKQGATWRVVHGHESINPSAQ
jgi:ketosteroid isomerase-like protein